MIGSDGFWQNMMNIWWIEEVYDDDQFKCY